MPRPYAAALLPMLLAAPLAAQARPAAPACPAPLAIDSVALIRDIFRLADDSMGGRLIGATGDLKARDYLAARFDALGLEMVDGGRLQRVPVASARLPGVTAAWNVLGIVPGSAEPDRYIVVTAHFDHVGIGRPVDGDSIYNGADDNASGAAALAVLADWFRRHPPRHSLLFAAVDGEERGMFGSRALVETPVVPLDRVLVDVNMDMISRNVNRELFAAGPGRYPAMRAPVESLVRCAGLVLKIGHDTDADGAANDWTTQSDHVQFHRKGIPFVYFGVEDHPDYHRPGDQPERVMPGFYVEAVRTVARFIEAIDRAR